VLVGASRHHDHGQRGHPSNGPSQHGVPRAASVPGGRRLG
jgi:hypothetical protein